MPAAARARPHRLLAELRRWVDSHALPVAGDVPGADRVEWQRITPLLALHAACGCVFLVGFSWFAVAVCAGSYVLRMFAITAFYHRYFAHRAFRTSRPLAFLFAWLANSAAQRGPLWWAAHHRRHHKHSDTRTDAHSPHHRGFWWSHLLWFTTRRHFATPMEQIRDFARHPELRFLDRFDLLAPATLALLLYALGEVLAEHAPGLGTSGWQLVVWGFVVSTVLLYHGTFTINSLGHLFGRRRYATTDHSRNSLLLALLTLGEGWHNNHHFYPVSVRQGFFWWELDPTFYALRAMQGLGLVWDLQPVPAHVRAGHRLPPRRGGTA